MIPCLPELKHSGRKPGSRSDSLIQFLPLKPVPDTVLKAINRIRLFRRLVLIYHRRDDISCRCRWFPRCQPGCRAVNPIPSAGSLRLTESIGLPSTSLFCLSHHSADFGRVAMAFRIFSGICRQIREHTQRGYAFFSVCPAPVPRAFPPSAPSVFRKRDAEDGDPARAANMRRNFRSVKSHAGAAAAAGCSGQQAWMMIMQTFFAQSQRQQQTPGRKSAPWHLQVSDFFESSMTAWMRSAYAKSGVRISSVQDMAIYIALPVSPYASAYMKRSDGR